MISYMYAGVQTLFAKYNATRRIRFLVSMHLFHTYMCTYTVWSLTCLILNNDKYTLLIVLMFNLYNKVSKHYEVQNGRHETVNIKEWSLLLLSQVN